MSLCIDGLRGVLCVNTWLCQYWQMGHTNHFITVWFLIRTYSGLQSRCQERNHLPFKFCFDSHQSRNLFMQIFVYMGVYWTSGFTWSLIIIV